MRATQQEYDSLELRAHSLLEDVPLHDVWKLELPHDEAGRTIADVRALIALENLAASNRGVRILFGLRSWVGRIFRWDKEPKQPARGSYLQRLSSTERESSLVAPGTREGPFQVLLVTPQEAISEIQNATVHAFSALSLFEHSASYELYWAIYVRPVGRITAWYMRLIDPFRRYVVYPAALRHIRAGWARLANSPRPTQ